MADETTRERFTLKRWSQRKLATAREAAKPASPLAENAAVPAVPSSIAPAAPASGEASASAALPPVESLTFDADFTAFMRPDVDPALKQAALKKLFRDPRFNVMDGLDVYIADFSKFEPLDAETARSLVSARYIFDPPRTRVNEQGQVEDVPPEEGAKAAPEADADAQAAAPPALAVVATVPPPVAPTDATPSTEPALPAPKDATPR